MICEYDGIKPVISKESIIFEESSVIGEVFISNFVSVWPGVVIRGDMAAIRIGKMTNVQDNAVIHCSIDTETVIGERVTIGHGAVLHSCTVEDGCLIGMNAVVLDNAVVGKNSIVAAGAVIKTGMKIPKNSLVAGNPGVIKKTLGDAAAKHILSNAEKYLEMARKYQDKT